MYFLSNIYKLSTELLFERISAGSGRISAGSGSSGSGTEYT